jgi:hypothetical protein
MTWGGLRLKMIPPGRSEVEKHLNHGEGTATRCAKNRVHGRQGYSAERHVGSVIGPQKTLEVLIPVRYAMWAKNRRNCDGKPI